MKLVSYLISTSVSELTKLPLQRVEAVTCPQNMSFKLDFASDNEIRRLTNLANKQTNPKVTILRGFDCGGGGGKKNQLAADVVVLKSAQTTPLE